MAYDKLRELLSKLIERTDQGKLNWEPTAADGVFQVSFPKYTIQLGLRDNDVVLRIRNEVGAVVEEVADTDFPEVSNAYARMKSLYENARRKALGVEQALDEILRSVDLDDDIPF